MRGRKRGPLLFLLKYLSIKDGLKRACSASSTLLRDNLLKYLSIKDGLKLLPIPTLQLKNVASKVPVHKRWIETQCLSIWLWGSICLLKYLSIKDGLKR